MNAGRPQKTFADYLVIAVSPVLIMLLVGSLSFFLVQVFYRGEGSGSVRWVLFWFVLAVVLVSRLGIEKGPGHAMAYGIALAAATWLYLVRVHPAYLVGVFLLAIVSWCAHKLTRDCTLIDEDEDASGHGLLQIAWWRNAWQKLSQKLDRGKQESRGKVGRGEGLKRPRASPHPPGVWLVGFSLAALPVFGVGQTLLPGDDADARGKGFACLFVYMAAALGLLVSTSFLGLRRYLRQRRLAMPGALAFGWVKFGVGVGAIVLVLSLLLPRPGADRAWQTLRYQLDHQLRRASEYAARFGPHGEGEGRPGHEAQPEDGQRNNGTANFPVQDVGEQTDGDRTASDRPGHDRTPDPRAEYVRGLAARLHVLFKILLLVTAGGLLVWWLIRRRTLIAQLIRSFIAAVKRFFSELFALRPVLKRKAGAAGQAASRPVSFAAYTNPFVTGEDSSWPPEQLIVYSYEALQVWAGERGVAPRPQQTAREFCAVVSEKHPDIGRELSRLSFLYGHAAYGTRLPHDCEMDSVRQLWSYLAESSRPETRLQGPDTTASETSSRNLSG